MVLGPAVSASCRNLLEMQSLCSPYPRLTNREWGQQSVLTSCPGDSDIHWSSRTPALGEEDDKNGEVYRIWHIEVVIPGICSHFALFVCVTLNILLILVQSQIHCL